MPVVLSKNSLGNCYRGYNMPSFAQSQKKLKSTVTPEPIKKDYTPGIEYETIPKSLDEIEKQISDLKEDIERSGLYIGMRLLQIKNNYLESIKFDTIYEYAFDKYGFSKTTTYSLMFVAENRERFRALGMSSKLYLLQRVPEEKWDEYIDWMKKENPTYRQIQDKINQENPKVIAPPKDEIVFTKKNNKVNINLRKMGKSITKKNKDSFQQDLEFFIKNWEEGLPLEETINLTSLVKKLPDDKQKLFWSKIREFTSDFKDGEI